MLWDHTQLYLIMDYVEQDLRQFMDTDARSRSLRTVKVAISSHCPSSCQWRSASLGFLLQQRLLPTADKTLVNHACWTMVGAHWCMGSDRLHLCRPSAEGE